MVYQLSKKFTIHIKYSILTTQQKILWFMNILLMINNSLTKILNGLKILIKKQNSMLSKLLMLIIILNIYLNQVLFRIQFLLY